MPQSTIRSPILWAPYGLLVHYDSVLHGHQLSDTRRAHEEEEHTTLHTYCVYCDVLLIVYTFLEFPCLHNNRRGTYLTGIIYVRYLNLEPTCMCMYKLGCIDWLSQVITCRRKNSGS